MKLVITTPTLRTPHGGTRILNEWVINLSKWYDVSLYVQDGYLDCPWYDLPTDIKVTSDVAEVASSDCLIIGSPHSIHLEEKATKSFSFLQMLEHLFNSKNSKFFNQCMKLYHSPNPIISYSHWNMNVLKNDIQRKGETIYMDTGINLNHFPIVRGLEKKDVVLVEGWESINEAKDVQRLGPTVAKALKREGYYIVAYSQHKLSTMPHLVDEYYQQPSLEKMNELYSRAKILLKATRWDARATAPLEAMTKGTPTARAIQLGDDDLIDGYNCLRVGYRRGELTDITFRLLQDEKLYNTIQENCYNYVEKMGWENQILPVKEFIEAYVKTDSRVG